jgi:folate-binding protein YgfZ
MNGDLERALRARGAVLQEFRGVTVPAHFGDVGREWRAASEGAGVFAAEFRTAIAATGEDRASFLQGMLSNDVKALAAGQGTYAAFLTQQGKVVSDLRVYARDDCFLLDVVAWQSTALREALERFIVADDVELATPEDDGFLVGVEGPLAGAVVGEAIGASELPQARFAQVRTSFEGAALLVIAASEVERSGMLLYGPRRIAPALFDACAEAGAQPIGMAALDTLRVESGVPWAGVDMDDTTLIMEVGRSAALSFSKGCYLGQEVVERIAARGHVNRQLTGLIIDGDRLPTAGARLLAEGHEVGYVTSAVRSQALARPVALAIVQSRHAALGQRLAVQMEGGERDATVSALPFANSDE